MASLRDIKIEGKLTPEALDISQCLRADKWIDHDHPDIIKKAKELTDDIEDDWERSLQFLNSFEIKLFTILHLLSKMQQTGKHHQS